MGWIRRIFLGEKDPYEFGVSSLWSEFFQEGIFHTETAYGYRVRYTLNCHFRKVNHQEFKRARMLEGIPNSR